jgi:hypothetical protein
MLASNNGSSRLPEVKQVQSAILDIIPRLSRSEDRRVSPLLLHALYKSATFEIDTQCTPPSIIRKHEFGQLKATLKLLKERWRLAGTIPHYRANTHLIHAGAYLQMLESIEVTAFCP